MRKSLAVMSVLIVLGFIFTGFSKAQKVIATQNDLTEPYESLGQIEVDRDVPSMSLQRGVQRLGEWVTFGKYDMPNQKEYLKGLLDEKLIKSAKKRYSAEAVIKVQYWPDLSSKKFPSGKIYAKGEMVRYKRFAS